MFSETVALVPFNLSKIDIQLFEVSLMPNLIKSFRNITKIVQISK